MHIKTKPKIFSFTLTTVIFTLLAFVPAQVYAQFSQEDFATSYDTTYTIDRSGTTQVAHKVTIRNLKNDVIATNYAMVVKKLGIYDIYAADKNGKIDVAQNTTNDETKLEVKLKSFVIGEGNQIEFTLFYKSKFIATKTGAVWNVNIPRSGTINSNIPYYIRIIVPNTFGPKLYLSPTPTDEKLSAETTEYIYTNDIYTTQNISGSFGSYQVLNFRIRYQIHNPNLFTSNYEIALPPTLKNEQLTSYKSLSVQPTSNYIDADDNYMAVYRLKPKQTLNIELIGGVKITSTQIDISNGGTAPQIPTSLIRNYTKGERFWETNDKQIKDIAKSLFDPKQSVTQNARNIYKFLVDNYAYDFEIAKKDFVDRKGAAKALSQKAEWGCMEFTDSFVAIARSMGIPARQINGYAISNAESVKPLSVALKSGDFLHAWPQFYDPNFGWVQIDPTWGDTSNTDYFSKMDTNHFAFAINGKKPDYPLPAGTYRTTNSGKMIEVDFAQVSDQSEFNGDFKVHKIFNWNVFKLLRGDNKYKVTNTSSIVLFDSKNNAILPGKSFVVYASKNDTKVTLYDAFGAKIEKQIDP